MSVGNFAASLAFTLGYEGGWSDNKADPGKGTMCGITQAVYDDDRDARELPRRSVRLSTAAERAAIYRSRYWIKANCDALPAGVDYAVFDYAVNSGVGRAVRTLQGIVGVEQDGSAGRYTLAAVQRYCEQFKATALTDALCHARLQYLQSLPTFGTFGRGWKIRVMGHVDGTQGDDTGVIDRAYDMTVKRASVMLIGQITTPKTYAASFHPIAASGL